ncbi:MAG: hypothetical protein K8S27_15660 [Candidatus Omnitrophica bacterium]|nr:hypothetical protein [Candidatus Omnitrophota bacterium]
MSKILKALNKVETARGSISDLSTESQSVDLNLELDPSSQLSVGWPTRNILFFLYVRSF